MSVVFCCRRVMLLCVQVVSVVCVCVVGGLSVLVLSLCLRMCCVNGPDAVTCVMSPAVCAG